MNESYRLLAPAARTFWALRGALPISGAAVALAVPGYILGLDLAALLVLVLGLAVVVWWCWLSARRYRAWGYAEMDRELVIRHGVMFQRLSVVPYGRMQFMDVFQGPIDRLLGVATVKLHTAAAATDATIPFVPEDEARRLRERLTELGESFAAGL